MANIPITTGSGIASIAAETVGGVSYQIIQVIGGGGSSVASIDPAGAVKVSVVGVVNIAGSVATALTTVPTTSVIQQGTVRASVVSSTPSSMLVGASVFGIPNPLPITGSVQGTITALVGSTSVVQQGISRTSVISSTPSSMLVGASVFGIPNPLPITGSVQGTVNNVITSIATANGGLPINSSLTDRIQGSADLRVVQGASVVAIAAQGAGVRTYIDHVQVSNYGSASVLVTIADNTTSILGYTIAPAGGGSNFDCMYRPVANSPITASINGTASVLVSLQGFKSTA